MLPDSQTDLHRPVVEQPHRHRQPQVVLVVLPEGVQLLGRSGALPFRSGAAGAVVVLGLGGATGERG